MVGVYLERRGLLNAVQEGLDSRTRAAITRVAVRLDDRPGKVDALFSSCLER